MDLWLFVLKMCVSLRYLVFSVLCVRWIFIAQPTTAIRNFLTVEKIYRDTCYTCFKIFVGLKCTGCGYSCHEKCMSHVPKNCSSGRSRNEANGSSSNTNVAGTNSSHSAQSPSDGK